MTTEPTTTPNSRRQFRFRNDAGSHPDHVRPGVLSSLWGGQVRSLAQVLDVTLDEVRERHESWATPEQIDATMMTVPPVASRRFASPSRGSATAKPSSPWNMSTGSRAAAPHCHPAGRQAGVHRVVVRGNPASSSTPSRPRRRRPQPRRCDLHRGAGGQRYSQCVCRAARPRRGQGPAGRARRQRDVVSAGGA